MPTNDAELCCPDCGARLSLFVEASDSSDTGVLVCDHSHVYDLGDPGDDQRLQDVLGSGYKQRILSLMHRELPAPLPTACAGEVNADENSPHA